MPGPTTGPGHRPGAGRPEGLRGTQGPSLHTLHHGSPLSAPSWIGPLRTASPAHGDCIRAGLGDDLGPGGCQGKGVPGAGAEKEKVRR